MDNIIRGLKVLWFAPKDFSPSGGLFWLACLFALWTVYTIGFSIQKRWALSRVSNKSSR